jgi:hypothetical protein
LNFSHMVPLFHYDAGIRQAGIYPWHVYFRPRLSCATAPYPYRKARKTGVKPYIFVNR